MKNKVKTFGLIALVISLIIFSVFLAYRYSSDQSVDNAEASIFANYRNYLVEPNSVNLIPNGNLENSFNGFSPIGTATKLNLSTASAKSGSKSLKVESRSVQSDGVGYNFKDIVKSGKTYSIVTNVRLVTFTESNLALTIKIVSAEGKTEYMTLASAYATNNSWVELSSTYIPSFTAPPKELIFYIEDLSGRFSGDFYVDEVQLKEVDVDKWRADVQKQIDEVRKKEVTLSFVDLEGKTISTKEVQITQVENELAVGGTIRYEMLNNQIYQDFVNKNFKWVVFENELKWYFNEKDEGVYDYSDAQELLKYAKQNAKQVRGHTIIGEPAHYNPVWLKYKSAPDLTNLLNNRIGNIVTTFDLPQWDVINESLDGKFFKEKLGDNIRADVFKKVKISDPNAQLFLNDYNIISSNDSLDRTNTYIAEINKLKSQGAILSGVGEQGHFLREGINPYTLNRKFNLLGGSTNLPIWITEFDTTEPDLKLRAQKLEIAFLSAMANPYVKGFMLWSWWDGHYNKGTNQGLIDVNGELNLAGKKYQELLLKYSTSQNLRTSKVSSSRFKFSGYKGKYEVYIKDSRGRYISAYFTLDNNSNSNMVITVNTIATSQSPQKLSNYSIVEMPRPISNIVYENSFEQNIDRWSGVSQSSIQTTSSGFNSSKSMKVFDRSNPSAGSGINLAYRLEKDKMYKISAYIKSSSQANVPIAMSVKKVDNLDTSYQTLTTVQANSSVWNKIEATFTLKYSGYLAELTIYFEDLYGNPLSNDFFIDDFKVEQL